MSRKDTLMTLRGKYDQLAPHLNEKTRRLWAATEAQAAGYGGVSLAAKAVGMSRTTVHAGLAELEEQREKRSPMRSGSASAVREGGGKTCRKRSNSRSRSRRAD